MTAWPVAPYLMSAAVFVLVSWRADAAELKVNLRSHSEVAAAIPTEVELLIARTDIDRQEPSKVADIAGQEPTEVAARVGLPGALTLRLAVGSWSVAPRSEGVWAHPLLVELEEPGTEVDLHLWPAARVSATLRVPRGENLPAGLRLRLRRAVEAPADPLPAPEEAETECLVTENHPVICTAPTGQWDLRFKAPGYAARYFWGVKVASGQKNELGVVELVRGASLMGRVVTEDGPADPRKAKVELRPVIDPTAASDEQQQGTSELTVSTGINAWGYFEVYDAPPGHYVVTAHQEGYAPASISPIALVAGEDTVLPDPLRLRPPVRLALLIDPPQEPYGGRWRIHLAQNRQSGILEEITEEEVVGGTWESPPIPPGRYVVWMLDSHDNEVFWEELEIVEDLQPLVVELDLVLVSGEVLLGEERLPADLSFGRRSGGARMATSSNEDGEFELVLPGTGEWLVDVASEEPLVQARGISVDVNPPSQSRLAHVVIELADTTVFGEVTDARGMPVRGALVRVYGLAAPETKIATVSCNSEGRFELRGQQPAAYRLEATAGPLRSEVAEVQLIDGSAVGPVRLVLGPQKKIQGGVFSESGPVPQAFVVAFPIADGGVPATLQVPQVKTKMDGSFELDWPPNSMHGRVAVLAPGYDFYVGRLSADSAEPAVITLGREGGTLRLEGLPVLGAPAAQPTLGLIVIDGEPIGSATVEHWAAMNGSARLGEGTVVVPAMPSGFYACCLVSTSEALLVMGGAALPKASACTEGYLPPGGELTLAAPDA